MTVARGITSAMYTALRATACESSSLTVSCYEQDVIHIVNAHYGRLENIMCVTDISIVDTECLVSGTRDVVYTRSLVHVY